MLSRAAQIADKSVLLETNLYSAELEIS